MIKNEKLNLAQITQEESQRAQSPESPNSKIQLQLGIINRDGQAQPGSQKLAQINSKFTEVFHSSNKGSGSLSNSKSREVKEQRDRAREKIRKLLNEQDTSRTIATKSLGVSTQENQNKSLLDQTEKRTQFIASNSKLNQKPVARIEYLNVLKGGGHFQTSESLGIRPDSRVSAHTTGIHV